MDFYGIALLAAIGITVWFVRAPFFRARLSRLRGEPVDLKHSRTGGIRDNDWKDLPPLG